ncbi:MAG: bifunctional metallophosphatase/5'-nucleotidase [Desulfobacterales bacterium]|nr:bifunctional metallophosphatase/5'-nucleotidase [Desulfobacterales bacterium]
MKKLLLTSLAMFATLIFFTVAGAVEVKIIYVSKMPEIETRKGIGGLAELGTLVKDTRKRSKYFLFLHGGDSLAPSAMSSFDRGTHMIDILNSIEPDAMAVSEREFAYKEDELILRISESAFPFISSNIYDPYTNGNLQGIEDSQCYNFSGYKICVLAVLDPIVIETYPPDRVKIDSNLKNIEKKAIDLRKKGADIVILMASHSPGKIKQMISNGIIDLAFYAISDEDTVNYVGKKLFLKQGTNKGKAIKVNINLTGKNKSLKTRYKASLVPLSDYPPDPVVGKKIQYYLAKLSKIMDVVVGETRTMLDTRKEIVRTTETNFGNLVADALRKYYGADIALINGGAIRGNRTYKPGTKLTRKDIQSELPFRDESRFVMIKGKNIISAFENGFSLYKNAKGRFLQASGLKVKFCPTSPLGSRVKSLYIAGKPIDPEKEYSLVASEYLIKGGDGFTMLKQSREIPSKKINLLLWEITRSYIENKKYISPEIEGRIVVECNGVVKKSPSMSIKTD